MERETDVLVIGSGIAGLTFALKAAEHARVLLVTKKERAASNTNYARGGIAAVLGDDDSYDLHIADTFEAGAGLCHREAVETVVREGPARVRELIEWGARFSREGGKLALGREGGHSRRRIVHATDRTGREIERSLLEAVADRERIEVLEDHLVLDFVVGRERRGGRRRCAGAVILDHAREELVTVRSRATLLAAGGCGQVYRHTTNPSIATGDGVAMAYRAGARLANLEFIQFHPTALYPTEDPAFLISEAVRGEGARLVRIDGTPFMDRYHPRGSLAPRDVVARAIDREMKEHGDPHVLLDLSPIPDEEFGRRFPAAEEGCRERGIDVPREPIPVVPAAHYLCGGVVTDMYGQTSLPGLYAVGETACTGIHGANRLASNSLLEAVVFSHRASLRVAETLPTIPHPEAESPVVEGDPRRSPEPVVLAHDREEIRGVMWDLVGIVRSDERLALAEERIAPMVAQEDAAWHRSPLEPELAELRNLAQTAHLIVRCARSRRESRGLHQNLDHPYTDNEHHLRDTILPAAGGREPGEGAPAAGGER